MLNARRSCIVWKRTSDGFSGASLRPISVIPRLFNSFAEAAIRVSDGSERGETCRTTAHLVNAPDAYFTELERMHGEQQARLAAESHTAAIEKIEERNQARGVGDSVKPGVERRWNPRNRFGENGPNPRSGRQPSVDTVARFAGSISSCGCDLGAHAPGFMLSCAPRTASKSSALAISGSR